MSAPVKPVHIFDQFQDVAGRLHAAPGPFASARRRHARM